MAVESDDSSGGVPVTYVPPTTTNTVSWLPQPTTYYQVPPQPATYYTPAPTPPPANYVTPYWQAPKPQPKYQPPPQPAVVPQVPVVQPQQRIQQTRFGMPAAVWEQQEAPAPIQQTRFGIPQQAYAQLEEVRVTPPKVSKRVPFGAEPPGGTRVQVGWSPQMIANASQAQLRAFYALDPIEQQWLEDAIARDNRWYRGGAFHAPVTQTTAPTAPSSGGTPTYYTPYPGGGGGGSSYKPAPPQYWIDMLNWRI